MFNFVQSGAASYSKMYYGGGGGPEQTLAAIIPGHIWKSRKSDSCKVDQVKLSEE